jgi:phytoene dehydrogenase-like protein
MNTRSHYDVAIIGAGMSGLAAGIRLAHFGKQVCIFERHNAAGGLNSFYSIGGRKFDVGLHAMTNFVRPGVKGTPLTKLLRQLRIERDEFALCEQKQSRVAFGPRGETVAAFHQRFRRCSRRRSRRNFPAQIDGFRRSSRLGARPTTTSSLDAQPESARAIVRRHLDGSAARGHAVLPGDVLRQRDRARHGVRPVRDHVQGALPRGLRAAVRGRARSSSACCSKNTAAPAASAG